MQTNIAESAVQLNFLLVGNGLSGVANPLPFQPPPSLPTSDLIASAGDLPFCEENWSGSFDELHMTIFLAFMVV